MSKATKLIALGVAGAGAAALLIAGPSLFGDEDEANGTRHLVNQVWIERLPNDQRDMIGHLVLIREHGRVGAAGKSSRWRHFAEIFKWGLEGDRLKVYFPQEEVRGELRVRTWKCRGDAPEPFELCLRISQGRRSVTYYSREDWVIDGQDVEGSLADLAVENPELANVADFEATDFEIDGESYEEVNRLPFLR